MNVVVQQRDDDYRFDAAIITASSQTSAVNDDVTVVKSCQFGASVKSVLLS